MSNSLPSGQYTATIYGAIKEQRYYDAIDILQYELLNFPSSRAALSLLAYCYYCICDYATSAQFYESLLNIYPESDEYKFYLAQALYKAGAYNDSLKILMRIDNVQFQSKVLMLQAVIKYELDELTASKSFLDQSSSDDPDVVINYANISYKEGKYEIARKQYTEAMNTLGYSPDLSYNIALCYYREKQYGSALRQIADIIEKGVRDHPELSVGSNTDGIEVKPVTNNEALRETYLIEAFNLKAAIEYEMYIIDPAKVNTSGINTAKEALTDMPPRLESDLDVVTLHNQALIYCDSDPSSTFKKLSYLLANPPYPPETFGNLLLLHCKYQNYDIVAGLLAENTELTFKYLSQEVYDYLDACIMIPASIEEAYRKFDESSNKYIDKLRKLTKVIQDARLARDNELIKSNLKLFDIELDKYIPILMAQARIYWNRENYQMVEKIFFQSAEFCSEHETWKLNVAHVFFMQESKWKDAIRYYEPIVKRNADCLIDITAIVLANLCVSYIMTSQNADAEELMRNIEREEQKLSFSDPDRQLFHLCIVNLVIGTLYCSKGNFEFGISRIIKSLDPYDKKIQTDTWFYAKRCFLALAESMSKNMIVLKDASVDEIITFLGKAEQVGKKIPAVVTIQSTNETQETPNTVAFEARQLKELFLQLHPYN